MKYVMISALAASILISCSQPPVSVSQPPVQTGHPIIQAYSQAYNDKDIETMEALMHPDIEWVSISGNEIEVHVSGKSILSKEMQEWFKNPKLPKGSLRDWSLNGDYVGVTETAHWVNDEWEEKSQSALTVYELQENLVRRVYYYPQTPEQID